LELNEEMKEVLKRRDTYVDHFKSELEAQGGQAQLDDAQVSHPSSQPNHHFLSKLSI